MAEAEEVATVNHCISRTSLISQCVCGPKEHWCHVVVYSRPTIMCHNCMPALNVSITWTVHHWLSIEATHFNNIKTALSKHTYFGHDGESKTPFNMWLREGSMMPFQCVTLSHRSPAETRDCKVRRSTYQHSNPVQRCTALFFMSTLSNSLHRGPVVAPQCSVIRFCNTKLTVYRYTKALGICLPKHHHQVHLGESY